MQALLASSKVNVLARRLDSGMTALHVAVKKGRADMVKLLLQTATKPASLVTTVDVRMRCAIPCVVLRCRHSMSL